MREAKNFSYLSSDQSVPEYGAGGSDKVSWLFQTILRRGHEFYGQICDGFVNYMDKFGTGPEVFGPCSWQGLDLFGLYLWRGHDFSFDGRKSIRLAPYPD